MKPDVPADDLPLLPPDGDIETKSVVRQAISANRIRNLGKGIGDTRTATDYVFESR